MYYELYIDVLFLENLILDYLLLRLLKLLLRCPTTQRRLVLAAVLGSGSFCILCGFSLIWTVPGLLISYLGVSVFMVKIGFHIRKWRLLIFATGLLYACGLLLGGIITWLQGVFPVIHLPFALLAVPALAVLEIMVRILVSVRKQKALLCQVSIFYGGVVRKTTGLWDTGNSLKDPLHNKPVSIVERRVLEPEVSGEELLFQIPYHSLGNTNGMLPALIADYLTIQLGDRTYVAERPVLGLTEEPLSGDSSYNLILNPNLVDS